MPVRRSLRLALAGIAAAVALLGLPLPARAAGLPYDLTISGGRLAAAPAAGGSTLAVEVTHTPTGVEFRPAAAAFPAGCSNLLDVTMCDTGLVSTGLVLGAPILDVTVNGLTTPQLALTGGGESDSITVAGSGSIGTLALDTGAGADSVTVSAAVGAITLAAGDTGADRYTVASNSPSITGSLALGDGNDVASSLAPNLDIDGGVGDDVLSGAGQLIGGLGDDVIRPRSTNELAAGGDGVDRLSFELMPVGLLLQKTDPTTVQVVSDPLVLKTGFEVVEGTQHADTLRGSSGFDALLGGEGNDTIEGHGGVDVLDGGPGANTVSYAWAAGPVTVDLGAETGSAGGPADTLRAFRSVVTGPGNDNVRGGPAAETFTLGAGDDVVDGGPGDDTIDGGPGNDELRGGHGNDTVGGGAGADTATYTERTQNEPLVITLASPGGDGAAGESDTLTGIENVVGGASNDMITGDDGPNAIVGGGGLDIIDGAGGADALFGGEGRDSISGGAGSDTLLGEGDDDSINAYDGEPDAVDCGASLDDDAQVDAADGAVGCEYSRRGDVPVPVDADGDGFVTGFDCDDANRAINPGATDVAGDGIDQNCDGFDEPVPFVDYGLSLSFSKATARGRRVTRLVVRDLPSGHLVQVSCRTTKRYARRCPFTRRTRRPSRAGNVSLTSLFRKRVLPPGTRLELQITAPGFNGRVRRFTVRRVGAVRDQRLCLTQGRRIPRPCPAGEE